MATRTPSKSLVRYVPWTKKNNTPANTDKPNATWQRWVFPGVLLFAVLVTWWVLFVIGQSGGRYGKIDYPVKLIVTVTIFHLVILAYPVVLIIKNKAWKRLIPAVILVFGIILLTWFGYTVAVGPALWEIRILGPIALILSAIIAYLLTRYPEVDHELVHQTESLAGLNESIKSQQRKADDVNARLQHAKRRAKSDADELSEAMNDAKERSDAFSAAEEAYKNSPALDARKDIKTELDKVQTEKTGLKDQLRAAEAEKSSHNDEQLKLSNRMVTSQAQGLPLAPLQRKYDEHERKINDLDKDVIAGLETQITELEDKEKELEKKLKKADKDLEASDEARNREAASIASAAATKKQQDLQVTAKKSADRERDLTADWSIEEGARKDLVTQRDDVLSRQHTAEQSRVLLWRDDVAVPAILAVVASLCYPSWYGWVTTIHAVVQR